MSSPANPGSRYLKEKYINKTCEKDRIILRSSQYEEIYVHIYIYTFVQDTTNEILHDQEST